MWRAPAMSFLVSRLMRDGGARLQTLNFCYSTLVESQMCNRSTSKTVPSLQEQYDYQVLHQKPDQNAGGVRKHEIGEHVSRRDKIKFLVNTLLDMNDDKEAIYGALDAWVAWETSFPIARLKNVLLSLEKEQQWHRVVQVIKWMLSKGQGNTMGTYGQLIQALDMDHRAEEAHMIWERKIGRDLHSVPWKLCKLMISVYHKNNMLDNLIKLFRSLEAYDRKPPEKSIVRKVADAYEMLGRLEDKERVLQKYNDLFVQAEKGRDWKSRNAFTKKKKNSEQSEPVSNSKSSINAVEDIQLESS